MVELKNVLYWISVGMMVPVITILVILFVQSLIMIGSFIAAFINRLKFMKLFKGDIQTGVVLELNYNGRSPFQQHLAQMKLHKENKIYAEKVIRDYEIECERDLASAKLFTRIGGGLGLMGTLIPLAPALSGLANGDLQSLSKNMEVAFTSTVVGVFIGLIGYVVQLVKNRWYVEDLNNLEFIYKLLFEQDEKKTA